jgi:hypothetical protein
MNIGCVAAVLVASITTIALLEDTDRPKDHIPWRERIARYAVSAAIGIACGLCVGYVIQVI